jgi:hypothetical protein
MNKLITTAILGLGLTMGATIASAQDNMVATITKVEGKVLVNSGDGFVPATEGMRLKPGDRVMLQDDSEAGLKFDDECSRDLGENRIVTVGGKSPCAGGALAEQGLEPTDGGAIGATGATGTGNGGVAAMVGIVAAIDLWWLSEDDHEDENDVASP